MRETTSRFIEYTDFDVSLNWYTQLAYVVSHYNENQLSSNVVDQHALTRIKFFAKLLSKPSTGTLIPYSKWLSLEGYIILRRGTWPQKYIVQVPM